MEQLGGLRRRWVEVRAEENVEGRRRSQGFTHPPQNFLDLILQCHNSPPPPPSTKSYQRRRVGGRDRRREEDVRGSMRRYRRREEVQGFQGPGVLRSQSPKDQDISNSHSNMSLTLKKVHLVLVLCQLLSLSLLSFQDIALDGFIKKLQ